MGNQMSASNDELLYNAAKSGDLKKVKDLLSKGTETGYRDKVSYLIIFIVLLIYSVVDDDDDDDSYVYC